MLRKTILISSPLYCATLIKSEEKCHCKHDEKTSLVCKPSELPFYPQEKSSGVKHVQTQGKLSSSLEEGIRVVRVEVQKVSNTFGEQKQKANELYNNVKTKTVDIVDYLNEKDNTFPRYGAIGLGGLSGYILGLRGGFFRRSFYGMIGAGIIASICYPKQAEMYAQQGLVEAKKYAIVGYNFAYGIKPGDNVNGPNFPKIPTSLSELEESLTDLAKSAKDAVFSNKK